MASRRKTGRIHDVASGRQVGRGASALASVMRGRRGLMVDLADPIAVGLLQHQYVRVPLKHGFGEAEAVRLTTLHVPGHDHELGNHGQPAFRADRVIR
jgi:hypothetical protein